MYSTQLAHAAYSQPTSPVRDARGTEAAAFERITARLVAASKPNISVQAKATALHENRQLWTVLASDAVDAENGLSPGLRAQILYLYEFTQLHTRKVLRGEDSAQALIEINTAVLRGLQGQEVKQ